VRQCLVPTLTRGETVLMDNLPVHKVAGVAEAILVEIGARGNKAASILMAGTAS
jgi:hypothetical protein